jgi:hypothetical protein
MAYFSKHPTPLETDSWGWWTYALYHFFQPIMMGAGGLIPDYFEDGWTELGQRPWSVVGFLGLFGVCFAWSRHLCIKIQCVSNQAWAIGLRCAEAEAEDVPPPRTPPLKGLRRSLCVWTTKFQRKWAPKIVIAGVLLTAFLIVAYWFLPTWDGSEPISPAESLPKVQQRVATFEFDTQNPLFATPITVQAGNRYEIAVEPIPEKGSTDEYPWFDDLHPASPDGVRETDLEESWVFRNLYWSKPAPGENWFKLLAAVGIDRKEIIPIGRGCGFTAKTSGRLFLFVNDAPRWYGNNHGKAKVTITKCDCETTSKP